MPRYRKKPVEVEARQLVDTNGPNGFDDLARWCGGTLRVDAAASLSPDGYREVPVLAFPVKKGGGEAVIHVGDWVIAERDGDGFYPCTAEQFAQTYEEV